MLVTDDVEIKAMASVVEAMEPLDDAQRRRVLAWLSQRFGIELGFSASSPQANVVATHPGVALVTGGVFDLSTDTIATVLSAKSGPDIIVAAAAHLHFVQGLQKFSRQQITAEMRTAPAHFKDTFVNNLSKYLTGLTRGDRLRLVATDTYALSSSERQALQSKLANA